MNPGNFVSNVLYHGVHWHHRDNVQFAQAIERLSFKELYMLSHCGIIDDNDESADVGQFTRNVEELAKGDRGGSHDLLVSLREAISRVDGLGGGSHETSPMKSGAPSSPTPHDIDEGGKRWLHFIVSGRPATRRLTSSESMHLKKEGSSPTGAPHPSEGKGNPPPLVPLSPIKSTVELCRKLTARGVVTDNSLHYAPPDEHETRVVALKLWIALVILLRQVAVTHLRDLVVLDEQLQFCRRYWLWASDNPRKAFTHSLLSWSKRSWVQLWRGYGCSAYSRETVHKLWELKCMETYVVESIGRVYNALESMNRSIRALQHSMPGRRHMATSPVSPVSTAAPLGSTFREGRYPNARSPHCAFGDTTSSTSGSSDDSSDDVEIVGELGAMVVHTIRSMAHRSTSRHQWTKDALYVSLDEICQLDDTTTRGDKDNLSSTVHRHRGAVPHVESVAFGDQLFHSYGSIDHAASMLQTIEASNGKWVQAWRCAMAAHMCPPAGRHWKGVMMSLAIATPILKIALTTTGDELREMIKKVVVLTDHVVRWYVVTPALDLYRSLFATRSGVQERREALARDIKSMAGIIKDYHADFYDEPTAGELEQIRLNAMEGDYGLIQRHLQMAIRHPIRAFFLGNLVRLTLIHVQQLKLDVSKVLASFDEVLETNDLNFRVMALGPFVMLSFVTVSYFVFRKKSKLQPAFVKLRLQWRSLHRLVTFAHEEEVGFQRSSRHPLRNSEKLNGNNDGIDFVSRPSTVRSLLSDEEQGRVLLLVHQMRCLKEFLDDYSLMNEFMEDLDDLEATQSTRQQRLRTLERMMAVHNFLASQQR